MWWHSHPLFVLPKGKLPEPCEGKEDEYKHFRKHHAREAWTYELVRRLRLVLRLPHLEAYKPPPDFVLRTLEELPIYVELTSEWREAIAASLNFHFGSRPVALDPDLLPTSATGYAELPRMTFDLTASDSGLKAQFLSMVNSLRTEHGIRRERRKTHMSKNKGKSSRTAQWHHLDYVCDPIGVPCPDPKPERLARNLAKNALSYVEAVAIGVLFSLQKEQQRSAHPGRQLWWPRFSVPKVPIQIKPAKAALSTTRYPCAEYLASITRHSR